MRFRVIEPVQPAALSDDDLRHLQQAATVGPYGYTAQWVIEQVAQGRMHLVRWPGGLMILELRAHPGGKELFIWSLAGKGYFTNVGKIYQDLEMLARVEDCRWISGFVLRPGFKRIYSRLFTPELWMELGRKELE